MTRADALPLARRLAAAVCELDGCSVSFCNYMRDGAYDDHREVQAALAALVLDKAIIEKRLSENVVSINEREAA